VKTMGKLFVVGVTLPHVPRLPSAGMLVGSKEHLGLYPDFEGERVPLKPPFGPVFERVEAFLE
jgi:hypothetical protein